MVTVSRTERAELCDLLDQLGPEAPTLCTGWSTADLAAHLVVRERKLIAAAGITVPALAGSTARAMGRLRLRHSFGELVALVRTGPPRVSPYRLPGAEAAANTIEFFVHHEDVRRAQPGWEPRPLEPGVEDVLWDQLHSRAGLMVRHSPVPLTFRRESGEEVDGRRRNDDRGLGTVTVVGRPAELVLYASGRQRVARVEQLGDDSAVAAAAQARLGT